MIVCGGENLMDVIEQPSTEGPRQFAAHAGGSPYNCSRAIGRLGGEVAYLGGVSTDSFGQQLLSALGADSVQHLGPRPDAPTTLAMVTVQDGQPDYRFYRDGTADRLMTASTMRAAFPDRAQALHLGSIALIDGEDASAWQDLFATVAQAGLFTSLDPNIRPLLADQHAASYRARLNAMAAHTSLIKLSDEDAAWWFPGLSPQAALKALASAAPQALIILTQGPGEVLCHVADRDFSHRPAPLAHLADTVGAGDTLMAAVLVGLARRGALTPAALRTCEVDLLQEVVADAARAAAITCTRTGCNPPLAQDLWGEAHA